MLRDLTRSPMPCCDSAQQLIAERALDVTGGVDDLGELPFSFLALVGDSKGLEEDRISNLGIIEDFAVGHNFDERRRVR